MAINLDNFIKINISSKPITIDTLIRVVLIGTVNLGEFNNNFINKIDFTTNSIFNTPSSTTTTTPGTTPATSTNTNLELLKKYLRIYFTNNGNKIRYIYCENINNFNENEIKDNEIMIAYCGEYNESLANKLSTLNGIKEKIYVAAYNEEEAPINKDSNVIYKYGDPGIEMEILAYYSNFSINASRLNDYCFTEILSNADDTCIIDDDITFKNLISNNNLNLNIELAGTIRNYGGNDVGQKDITNNFIRIYMTQVITNNLINLLSTKLVYNDSSVVNIINNISNSLDLFKNKGYLRQSAVWTGGDVKDASDTHLIIENNTILSTGYKITVLPISSLSNVDKAAHKLPPIYIYIADTYSIRQIEITGSII